MIGRPIVAALLFELITDLSYLLLYLILFFTPSVTQVRSFFGSLTEESGSDMRCILQAYESIEDNIRWMDANLPLLQAWLDKRSRRSVVHEDL